MDFNSMDSFGLYPGPYFYDKRRDSPVVMDVGGSGGAVERGGFTTGLSDHLCRKYKEKEDKNFGKKIWYLGETIRKLYDIDRDPERKKFLDEYFTFMRSKGATVTKIPVVAKLPLDLYRLYQVVDNFGGFAQVRKQHILNPLSTEWRFLFCGCKIPPLTNASPKYIQNVSRYGIRKTQGQVVKKRRWSKVVRQLDLPSSITSAAFTLRTQYLRLLYSFECEKKGMINKIGSLYHGEREEGRLWSPVPLKQEMENHIEKETTKMHEKRRELGNERLFYYEGSKDVVQGSTPSKISRPLSNFNTRESKAPSNKEEFLSSTKRSRSAELVRDDVHEDYNYFDIRPHSLGNHNIPAKQEHKDLEVKRHAITLSDMNREIKSKSHDDSHRRKEDTLLKEYDSKMKNYQSIHHDISPRLERNEGNSTPQEKDAVLPDLCNGLSKYNSYDMYDSEKGNLDMLCPCKICNERRSINCLPPPYLSNSYIDNSFHRVSDRENVSPYRSDVDANSYYPRMIRSTQRKKYNVSYENEYSTKYKFSPYNSCSGEMNIKIEERTDTALALTVAVDGISYTGTLLSKLR